MGLTQQELKEFMEEKYLLYNQTSFIETDPIQIPHEFGQKEDIEIAAFLAATIAWGQRKTIIRNANQLMELMDRSPLDFIVNAYDNDFKPFEDFKHRTFNGEDIVYFLKALRNIYRHHGGLEKAFAEGITAQDANVGPAISHFRTLFFSLPHPARTTKHVSDPSRGSSAKRLNMFLRWMVRKDKNGVDFGLWKSIRPGQLLCPLDVHTGNVGRKLELLQRQQNDWKAVTELTDALSEFDPGDPVKYDFALFGLGAFEGF